MKTSRCLIKILIHLMKLICRCRKCSKETRYPRRYYPQRSNQYSTIRLNKYNKCNLISSYYTNLILFYFLLPNNNVFILFVSKQFKVYFYARSIHIIKSYIKLHCFPPNFMSSCLNWLVHLLVKRSSFIGRQCSLSRISQFINFYLNYLYAGEYFCHD